MQVTAVNLGGYLVAFFGVCWYNYKKLQGMKAKQAAAAASAALAKAEANEDSPLLKGALDPNFKNSTRQSSPARA